MPDRGGSAPGRDRRTCPAAGARGLVTRRRVGSAGTASALPFSVERLHGPVSTASRTSASVCSPIRISPGWAACSSRAATLTASPVARRSPVPVTTSPCHHADAVLRGRDRAARRASRLRPQARSASSSCSCGTPKTAITASPMNFSTVPPWRSTIALHALEVARQQRPEPPPGRSTRPGRRAGQVAEDDGDRLALLALCRHRPSLRPPGPISIAARHTRDSIDAASERTDSDPGGRNREGSDPALSRSRKPLVRAACEDGASRARRGSESAGPVRPANACQIRVRSRRRTATNTRQRLAERAACFLGSGHR